MFGMGLFLLGFDLGPADVNFFAMVVVEGGTVPGEPTSVAVLSHGCFGQARG